MSNSIFSNFNSAEVFGGDAISQDEYNQKIKEMNELAALDTLKSQEFAEVARRYYGNMYYMGGLGTASNPKKNIDKLTHEELIEVFYDDRIYANNNTLAISADLAQVMSMTDEEKQDYAYLSRLYQNLPAWWNDKERSFPDAMLTYGAALIVDPINLIGFGVGGQAAKQVYKQAVTKSLQGLVKSQITKEVLEGAAKEASQQGLTRAVVEGAVKTGGVSAAIAGGHDAMLQATELEAGLAEDWSLWRSAVAVGAGGVLGSVFGGGFSYLGFVRSLNKMNKNTMQILDNQHMYGTDRTGGKITTNFKPLTAKQLEKAIHQNIDEKISVQAIKNGKVNMAKLREVIDAEIVPRGKPPQTKFNTTNIQDDLTARNIGKDAEQLDDIDPITNAEIIDIANKWVQDPKKVEYSFNKIKTLGGDKGREFMTAMLTSYRATVQLYQKMQALAKQLVDSTMDDASKKKILAELDSLQSQANKNLQKITDARTGAARVLQSLGIGGDDARFMQTDLRNMIDIEDVPLSMKDIEGTWKQKLEFWESFGKLSDPAKRAAALENVNKYKKWDVANSFVNNNLLASPDTNFLNLLSGLANTQWKPFVQLIRSGRYYLSTGDKARAYDIANEAMKMYILQFRYLPKALEMFGRSLYRANPILDPKQTRLDNQIRQNALHNWLQHQARHFGGTLGAYAMKPVSLTVSMPMRVISATDEFLKQLNFNAKAHTLVDTHMRRNFSHLIGDRNAYKKQWRKEFAKYTDENGRAKSLTILSGKGDAQKFNDPLQYAREASYTQSLEGYGAGGFVLGIAEKYKWTRFVGLHFVSTPTNLLRWSFQHVPFFGRYQFQMREMLKKGADGKYLNPEAAAEAKARMDAGLLLWTTAGFAAATGVITGGGSKDLQIRREQQALGWQPYSIRIGTKENGLPRYASMNRLDPMFLPFGIMADLVDYIQEVQSTADDLPKREADKILEASVAAMLSLTRNLTSKFYTKNMIDLAQFLLSGGFAYDTDPEQSGANVAGQFLNKIVPSSGMIRYLKRVNRDADLELRTFADKLIDVSPFHWEQSGKMPKRNVFGEIVKNKTGWFFGFGGDDGILSSPFMMTQVPDEVSEILLDLDLQYTPPSRTDPKTGIDLDDYRSEKNQTAWDYWMQMSGEIKIGGKTMKEEITDMLTNKSHPLNYHFQRVGEIAPNNVYDDKKLQQQTYIIDVIRRYQKFAFAKYLMHPEEFGLKPEFPELKKKFNVILDKRTFVWGEL